MNLGCVPPLLEVALRKFFPLLSVFCSSRPCCSLPLHDVIFPSHFGSASRSSFFPHLPLCSAYCPPIVLHSCHMSSPSPFCIRYVFYDVEYIGFHTDFFIVNLSIQFSTLNRYDIYEKVNLSDGISGSIKTIKSTRKKNLIFHSFALCHPHYLWLDLSWIWYPSKRTRSLRAEAYCELGENTNKALTRISILSLFKKSKSCVGVVIVDALSQAV